MSSADPIAEMGITVPVPTMTATASSSGRRDDFGPHAGGFASGAADAGHFAGIDSFGYVGSLLGTDADHAAEADERPRAGGRAPRHEDLLDRLAAWGSADTLVGRFHLVPARIEQDLPLISRWMNDPAAAAFWELSGAQSVTEDHLRAQLAGDGRSVPCMGVLDGAPMSYWEIYRADLDPLARYYPVRRHDTGIHLLVGGAADRGRGLGGLLLRAVADLVLARRPSCARVIAEPDIRNTPSIAAFLTAGFRFSAEVDLPAKRAALMVRERSLRHLL
ncbi:GNAT family N-acetyltransferase [Streptomyces sp. NPDC047880]|uniref:GNAT family N-acetyltransferase n=1 Tax=Streptomyces sp. NPDC047880 TaxID=3155626 RepID=UPI003451A9A2